jgi:acyl transferase domain-containing protein
MTELENNGSLGAVAVVGMAGRFPGAADIRQLWGNLADGVESVTFFSDEELIASGIDPEVVADPAYVKAGTLLDGADLFDAEFFNFSPRDAEILDPQHRLFLECSHHALEDAGYDPQNYDGLIGVFAGSTIGSYLTHHLTIDSDLASTIGKYQLLLGNDKDFVATRVGYKLNLKGPCLNIQTACSTSLVAVHLACQSLLNSECDIALAGGISVRFPLKTGYNYQEEGILSPDGHCRAFDAKAAGTVGGNGVGIVVLKRLSEAIANGDTVHAVILGSAINNDGSLKVGYTAPSVDGQAQVVTTAHALAGVDPSTITYIEAHGTGTLLGDPIEVKALTQAFRETTNRNGYCAIGSIKTNLGHCDAAAGVAGLIKTVLSLKHRNLVPSLHFETPNPRIDFANSPFYVNTELKEWKRNGTPLRAGVSSFGIGGTNAHVVLEEPPELAPTSTSRESHLILLSAKTPTALQKVTENLSQFLKCELGPNGSGVNLADVAYTLQVGRTPWAYRRALVCGDMEEAVARLDSLDPLSVSVSAAESADREIVFMFPGQGAQQLEMGRDLYEREHQFRAEIDRCSELLRSSLGCDLRELLYPISVPFESAAEQLKQTAFAQPALFVVEYALARLWMHWGVKPQCMVGHSVGEYVAACISGVLDLKDALQLVAARGRLMQSLPPGAMLAVTASPEDAKALLLERLSLAVINTPSQCVISGPMEDIDRLQAETAAKGIESRMLRTSHAFHSTMMEPILEAFVAEVQKVRLSAPTLPYLSNVTGSWITAAEATNPRYWADHLRHTVRFADNVTELLKSSERLLLEVGPGQTLTALVKQHPAKKFEHIVVSSLPHPSDTQPEGRFLLKSIGELWCAGTELDWTRYYQNEQRRRIPLPTYPFERRSYWIDPRIESKPESQFGLAKKKNIEDWFYAPVWKQSLLTRTSAGAPVSNKSFLVFIDKSGLGKKVVENLRRESASVFAVEPGEDFAVLDQGYYSINPQQAEDYERLFDELEQLGGIPEHILHLWSVSDSENKNHGDHEIQEYGFFSLLRLTQAIGNLGSSRDLRLVVGSTGLHRITGEEFTTPEKATLLGAVKVIPQEYENITCRSVDLTFPRSGVWSNELIERLLSEFDLEPPNAPVAYRGRTRWSQTFEQVKLSSISDDDLCIRDRGVYLVTGGLGGIGLAFAEYLGEKYLAKLVLVGRSPFPALEEWEEWLTNHANGDLTSQKIHRLRRLGQIGAEVLVLSADVSDKRAMQELLSLVHDRFGAINGVIHAAGVAGGGIIQLKTTQSASETLAPKVKGTQVFTSLLADAKLDFFVLCSSLISVLGASSHADYCAANAFLDSFAQTTADDKDLRVVTINWNMWRDTGMAISEELPDDLVELRRRMQEFGLSTSEGVEVFRRALVSGLPQLAISKQHLPGLLAQKDALMAGWMSKESQTSSLQGHSRPNLNTTYLAPRNDLERKIASIWEELLGLEQVGVHDNFFQLGGHSLLGTRLLARIQDAFQVSLTLRRVFEMPTVSGLAEAIELQQEEREQTEKLKLLELIEQLADDEIDAELAKRLQVGDEQIR